MGFNVVLFNDSEVKFGFTRSSGAYCIASVLEEQGYETLVVNYSMAIDWNKFKTIIDLSVDENTLIVGFSVNWFDSQVDIFPEYAEWEKKSLSINFQKKNLQPFTDYIKSINSKTKIIIGGFNSHRYINEAAVDNVFIGYSESQILDYANSISNTGPRRIFNKIINYDTKAKNYNFNSSSIKYSAYDLIHPEELLFIEFARGCIFKCAFCTFPLIGSKTVDYLKYQEVVYNELLTNYEKWGTTNYFIVDDTFNDSVEKLKAISEVIDRLPFKPTFGSYIRIDLFASHPEMANLLKNIGLKFALYGLETWNTDTAKIIKKGGSRERKIKALKIAKDCWGSDIAINANLIVGLPNDTTESFDEFITWYKEEGFNYIDHVVVNSLHLSPNDDKNPYTIYLSDIDVNKEEYGYSFENDEKIDERIDHLGGRWEKTDKDTGNIRSRDQASKLARSYYSKIEEIQKQTFSPTRLTSPKLLNKLREKFKVDSFLPERIIYKIFESDYYPRLIQMLEDRKNNDKRD